MRIGKRLLKTLIRGLFPHEVQQKIRVFYLARQVCKNRGFREPEISVLHSIISIGNSVADIGANGGVYSKELSALVGPYGRVYAFEPISENLEILETVIRKGGLFNVRAFHSAVSVMPGFRTMVIPDLNGFTGYYWAHFAGPGDSGRTEEVEVVSLDGLWKEKIIPRLDFIKCDVEGSELEVIQGARELIRDQRPGWLIEVSRNTSTEVFGVLKEAGYQAFVYTNRLLAAERYRDKEFSNYFFFHPDSRTWERAIQLTVLR